MVTSEQDNKACPECKYPETCILFIKIKHYKWCSRHADNQKKKVIQKKRGIFANLSFKRKRKDTPGEPSGSDHSSIGKQCVDKRLCRKDNEESSEASMRSSSSSELDPLLETSGTANESINASVLNSRLELPDPGLNKTIERDNKDDCNNCGEPGCISVECATCIKILNIVKERFSHMKMMCGGKFICYTDKRNPPKRNCKQGKCIKVAIDGFVKKFDDAFDKNKITSYTTKSKKEKKFKIDMPQTKYTVIMNYRSNILDLQIEVRKKESVQCKMCKKKECKLYSRNEKFVLKIYTW